MSAKFVFIAFHSNGIELLIAVYFLLNLSARSIETAVSIAFRLC
ncbi:hypothetical protein [Bacillus aquiflavi]|nr:hypothetical protein [Bacillus aquiflavi]